MAWNITPYQEKGWDPHYDGGVVATHHSSTIHLRVSQSGYLVSTIVNALIFIYGYVLNYGVLRVEGTSRYQPH